MKIGYFLSIMLILQSTTSIHAMAGRVCNLLRNSSMLLPRLTNHTAPLFARSLHATKNISLPSYRLFQQKPRPQNFNRNFLIATAGLSLWGHNRLNSMTVHAQEEELKYSKEMTELYQQFEGHLKEKNIKDAAIALHNMRGKLKEDGDCNILAYTTNRYLVVTKDLMIKEAIRSPKNQIENLLNIHISFVIMANGSMNNIEKNRYIVQFPAVSADIFLAIREHKEAKQNFLKVLERMESQSNRDEVFIEVIKTIKAILNGEIQ